MFWHSKKIERHDILTKINLFFYSFVNDLTDSCAVTKPLKSSIIQVPLGLLTTLEKALVTDENNFCNDVKNQKVGWTSLVKPQQVKCEKAKTSCQVAPTFYVGFLKPIFCQTKSTNLQIRFSDDVGKIATMEQFHQTFCAKKKDAGARNMAKNLPFAVQYH